MTCLDPIPGTTPTDGAVPTNGHTGLFRAIVRQDMPENPEAFVLIGTTAFLGMGFLVMALAVACRILTKGDLGTGALTAVTGTGASLALLVAYVRGRRPDGGAQ